MAKTRARDLATGLGRAIANSTITAAGAFTISGGRTVQNYSLDSAGALLFESTTGKVSGDMAYLKKQNQMYVWNDSDSSWFKVRTSSAPLSTLSFYPLEDTGGEFINNSPPDFVTGGSSGWDNVGQNSVSVTANGRQFFVQTSDVSTVNNFGAAARESLPAGKRYFEIKIISGTFDKALFLHHGTNSASTGYDNNSAYFIGNGKFSNAISSSQRNTGLGSVTTNDIIMYCYDTTASKYWVGKNGVWQDQGTPDGGLFEGQTMKGTDETVVFGVLGTTTNTTNTTFLFQDRLNLTYTPPTGFTAI